jgi:hypothetical protein
LDEIGADRLLLVPERVVEEGVGLGRVDPNADLLVVDHDQNDLKIK